MSSFGSIQLDEAKRYHQEQGARALSLIMIPFRLSFGLVLPQRHTHTYSWILFFLLLQCPSHRDQSAHVRLGSPSAGFTSAKVPVVNHMSAQLSTHLLEQSAHRLPSCSIHPFFSLFLSYTHTRSYTEVALAWGLELVLESPTRNQSRTKRRPPPKKTGHVVSTRNNSFISCRIMGQTEQSAAADHTINDNVACHRCLWCI